MYFYCFVCLEPRCTVSLLSNNRLCHLAKPPVFLCCTSLAKLDLFLPLFLRNCRWGSGLAMWDYVAQASEIHSEHMAVTGVDHWQHCRPFGTFVILFHFSQGLRTSSAVLKFVLNLNQSDYYIVDLWEVMMQLIVFFLLLQMTGYVDYEPELWINNNKNNKSNNNSQLHWYCQGYVDISSYLFSVSWGGGVGRGTHEVGGLLLCSWIQAGRLYAMTPTSNIGRCVDGGQWLWHGSSQWHGCGERMLCCSWH